MTEKEREAELKRKAEEAKKRDKLKRKQLKGEVNPLQDDDYPCACGGLPHLIGGGGGATGWGPKKDPSLPVSEILSEKVITGGSYVKPSAPQGSTSVQPYLPTNDGFLGKPATTTLLPVTKIDRFGGTGYFRFFSPQGTPLDRGLCRRLRHNNHFELSKYKNLRLLILKRSPLLSINQG